MEHFLIWGVKCTAKNLKSGKIFSYFAFGNNSVYCDMWLSCLSCATTSHPSRFSKSTRYTKTDPFQSSAPSDLENSQNLWSQHKRRHQYKAMTFCSTTGHVVAPYFSSFGKYTDNQIFQKNFDNEISVLAPFLEMLQNHQSKTLV